MTFCPKWSRANPVEGLEPARVSLELMWEVLKYVFSPFHLVYMCYVMGFYFKINVLFFESAVWVLVTTAIYTLHSHLKENKGQMLDCSYTSWNNHRELPGGVSLQQHSASLGVILYFMFKI